jgi:large subunit ribosomal protein L31
MKKEGHPPYQDILFVDSSTGFRFVCGSTLQPKEREVFEGKEYPVYKVPVSSASHPFFTGSSSFIDSEGRVDKFVKRYAKKAEQHKEEGEKEEEAAKQAAAKKKTKKKSTST